MSDLLDIFQPIEVGPVTIPNRIVRSAHATGLATYGIDDDLICYHEARVRGGVGLTILEAAAVNPSTYLGAIVTRGWEASPIIGSISTAGHWRIECGSRSR